MSTDKPIIDEATIAHLVDTYPPHELARQLLELEQAAPVAVPGVQVSMSSIEKLIADHAYWSDEFRRLKAEGKIEYGSCANKRAPQESCIGLVYNEVASLNEESMPYDGYSFDEVWENGEVDICDHCRKLRELKKKRIAASRKLGGIRAAMTRIGRRINDEQQGGTES